MLPLQGVRILDLGTVLMAPYAGQWLADLGADVIKVEPPAGDSTRRTGITAEDNMAAMFLSLNRNKRGIVLDLKTAEGRQALLRLVDEADILIQNTRPQKMQALGLDPTTLLDRHPRLIYASFHGFGATGPYGGQPAYDDVIQGMCGLVDLMDQNLGAPRYVPSSIADKTAGLIGAVSILAALHKRDRTGMGGHVEIPMFESMVSFTAVEHFAGLHYVPPRGPAVYSRIMANERRPFATANGYICVLPYTDKHWRSLFVECQRSDLLTDTRFQSMAARTENTSALYAILAGILVSRTTDAWVQIFDRLEIPCGPIASLTELLRDPQLVKTDFFSTIESEGSGTVRFPGVPILFDGKRPPIRMAPRLGQHTREVLDRGAWLPVDTAE
jgi:crotonobetainyl-CoA:carnitine CoA-transferase CaiB-like acyl-CoA transferase